MSINPNRAETALISDMPLDTVMSDHTLDTCLLSDKATIAGQFFTAFGAKARSSAEDTEALDAAATEFVDRYQIGKWDLLALLDGALPKVNILALFAYLADRIGTDPARNLFFEGERGILVRHPAATD